MTTPVIRVAAGISRIQDASDFSGTPSDGQILVFSSGVFAVVERFPFTAANAVNTSLVLVNNNISHPIVGIDTDGKPYLQDGLGGNPQGIVAFEANNGHAYMQANVGTTLVSTIGFDSNGLPLIKRLEGSAPIVLGFDVNHFSFLSSGSFGPLSIYGFDISGFPFINAKLEVDGNLTSNTAANHHVVTGTSTPASSDFYLSLGFAGDVPTIYGVQQGVGGLPVNINAGVLVSAAFTIGFDGSGFPQFYDVSNSCIGMNFDGTAGIQVCDTSGTVKARLTRAGSLRLWGGSAPASQPTSHALMTDGTGGAASTTLSACGDTSGSDQSGVINNNIASVNARLDEIFAALGPTKYNAWVRP